MSSRASVLLALALVACAPRAAGIAPTATVAPSDTVVHSAEPTATPAATTSLRLSITDSRYGVVAIQTAPGASCAVDVVVVATTYGEVPPATLASLTVPASGIAQWTYATPRLPDSNGVHWVTCKNGSDGARESKGFAVARAPIAASGLTVRVATDAAPKDTVAPDPSLVPLRDATAAKMRATLAAQWKTATRGLGLVEVVERSADITIFVVAGRGTSVHRSSDDGSQDIVVYVSDPRFGPETTENLVATALHELGHIWCCRGDGSDGQGHWLEKVRDPGLYGVDKFGLMTDPVTCEVFGTVVSCPNRFSDREMRALGFASFPPPAPDPCVTQGIALSSELKSVEAQLASTKAQIDAEKTKLASLDQQIKSLEAQYPGGLPPTQYTLYQSLIAQYNALVQSGNARVASYNALIERDRVLVNQVNALLCDWT